jgi:hypothetical protein
MEMQIWGSPFNLGLPHRVATFLYALREVVVFHGELLESCLDFYCSSTLISSCSPLWDLKLERNQSASSYKKWRGWRHPRLYNLRWIFRVKRRANPFLQTSHEKGRSPMCRLMWFLRAELCTNVLVHILHEKGRSPLCTLRCQIKWERWTKCFLHISHENGRSRLCTPRWFFTS